MAWIEFRGRGVATGAITIFMAVAVPSGTNSGDTQPPVGNDEGIRFTAADVRDGKHHLTISLPPGFTHRLDIFTTTNLMSAQWTLAAPGEAVTGNTHKVILDSAPGPLFFVAEDADHDTDGDGLPDGRERRLHRTSPTRADTDGDGIPDPWEISHGFNPLVATDGAEDADGDGLSNREEHALGTHPRLTDTDGDGLPDLTEVGWKTVCAWGGNGAGQCDPPPGLSNVVATAAGGDFTLALTSDGGVVAWGGNDDGQCDVPDGLDHVIAIAAGQRHAVALRSDGTPTVWGNNWFDQDLIPPSATNLTALASGANHVAALRSDGTVLVWGDTEYGQCETPAGLAGIVALAAGWNHTLALGSDGAITAWGDDSAGQCSVPEDLDDAVGIAASGSHSMALFSDGSIRAWGSNQTGQCDIPEPAGGIVSIAAGGRQCHSAAARADGSIAVWGDNEFGQCSPPPGLPPVSSIAAGAEHTVAILGLHPALADTDGDGMPDGWEIAHRFNPCDPRDGPADSDGDGLSNREELLAGTDPRNPDTDGDGYSDGAELLNGLDPLSPDPGAAEDRDGDGVSNAAELAAGTDPDRADTDGDSLPDGWEQGAGLDPLDPADGDIDHDGDGASTRAEYAAGTDPFTADSDGDGMPDGWELRHGLDPLDPADAHHASALPRAGGQSNLEMFENPIDQMIFLKKEIQSAALDKAGFDAYLPDPNDLRKRYLTEHTSWTGQVEYDELLPDPIGPGELTARADPSTGEITVTSRSGTGFPMDDGDPLMTIFRGGAVDLGGYTPCLEEGWVGGGYYYDDELEDFIYVPPEWECVQYGDFVRWGRQEVESTLADEYTTELLRTNLKAAVPSFTGNYEDGPHWDEMISFNFPEPVGGLTISEDAAFMTSERARYVWHLGHVSSTPIFWMEHFTPHDDPDTPQYDESTDRYPPVIRSWSGEERVTPVFEIDPFTRNGGAYGTYSITVLPLKIVPDWDHDQIIGFRDEHRATPTRPFRFWINDDNDSGDVAVGMSDTPLGAGSGNAADSVVNGRRDTADFFPVWLDLHWLLTRLPPGSVDVEIALKQEDGAVNIVYTDLPRTWAGEYLIADRPVYGPRLNVAAHEAPVHQVDAEGLVLEKTFIQKIREDPDKGVVLVEGRVATDKPLVLEIRLKKQILTSVSMPMKLASVNDMFRTVNLRSSAGDLIVSRPGNCPATVEKNVVFVHGFSVDPALARTWHTEMFKRLHRSGSRARYHGVIWRGDIGGIDGFHYHANVVNAFATAPRLAAYVDGLPGQTVAIAHSLGNMVVSSALRDHGMNADWHLMLNAAVPAESYDISAFNENSTDNPMLHEDWAAYAPKTWCSIWHRHFAETPDDDRSKLTWNGLFASTLTRVYNFFSSGDEVFELYRNGTPDVVTTPVERYAWQKQELFKGRGQGIGTSWAGWAFSGYWEPDLANGMCPEMLRRVPVFSNRPNFIHQPNIHPAAYREFLARGAPALSPAAGVSAMSLPGPNRNFDLNDADQFKTSGWGRDDNEYRTRWLHSDCKDMAYYYTHNLFNRAVELGSLK